MVERIIEVTDDKYHYSSGYYTVNKWIDRENVVLARSEKQTIGASDNPKDDKTELVRCNVFTGEKEVLCNDVMAYQEYLVYKNLLYYVNGKQLIRINLDTKDKKVIFEKDGICCPHITNDGKVIRLNFPPLTEERRKELVKQVKKYTEEAKVQVRNVRRDALEGFKDMKKKGEITEDDLKNTEKDIQKLTDKYTDLIDSIYAEKEQEIISI